MTDSPVQMNVIDAGWSATHMEATNDHLYAAGADGQLRRMALVDGVPADEIEVLSTSWPDRPFAVVGDHLYTAANGGLSATPLRSGRLGDAVVVSTEWSAATFAGGGEHLYWAEDDGRLLRTAASGGRLSSAVETLSPEFDGKQIAAGDNAVCWTRGENQLVLARIGDGAVLSSEVVAEHWDASVFAGAGDQLFYVTPDGELRSARRTPGNGNYVHFINEAYDWEGRVPRMKVEVLGPGKVVYYTTWPTHESPTGTPYEPKRQDYSYSIWWEIWKSPFPQDGSVRVESEGFKVEAGSKRAFLRWHDHDDDLHVDIEG